ncbi:formyltetrahydrofolate deformylase [Phenylobacterium montanum]|uniref:Formyltetrahydrofolate deformylase n=1 Tax=Phenylobacterium montanum TaxID=2823693 RepID=A0A975G451_9CAUL|nr:formyltetrahydrofolate deformylase [Caulobacter sp. S6]QUD90454.1 formyltetrahydrofolate deformylase [Caulobacter sp. S6]
MAKTKAAAASPYILILKCPDRKGVVAAVSGYLADNDASILESNHFNDSIEDMFYMRTVFRADGPGMPSLDKLRQGFEIIADRFHMEWAFHDASIKPRVLLAVSKFGHCLYDLMHRWKSGLLPVEIVGVMSNHDDMRSFVEWNGVPYFHLPITKDTKAAQEAQFLGLVEELRADLVVLARYMQILSPDLCAQLSGRCINIHHSFLPSFKGAKPYHQAWDRGVKLIGATAHYVTTDLDEGPIIEQGAQRVDHRQTPDDLVAIGRDVECSVLARAVTWHVEHRVIVNGHKTVVFA